MALGASMVADGQSGASSVGAFAQGPMQRVVLFGPDGEPLPRFSPDAPGYVQAAGRSSLGVLFDNRSTTGVSRVVTPRGDEALVTVIGAGGYSIRMEGSQDETSWFALPCSRLDDGSYALQISIRARGSYAVDVSGWQRVRANCTHSDGSAFTLA